jgi:hypothetical protein
LIALLAGSLVAIGCGDSGSSNGGDDIDPNELCNVELCIGDVPHRVELRDGSSEWIGNLRDLRRLINVGVKSGVIAA